MLTSQSLASLRTSIKECSSCQLGSLPDGQAKPTPSVGPMDAEVVIIGRNPGREEERLGEPLIGPAGMLLTQFLELCGLDRDQCYLTNLAMCFSAQNRPPSLEEYKVCSQWKKLEFMLLKPKLVFLLGNDCLHFFYPTRVAQTVTQLKGQVFDGFELEGYGQGFKVIVFPHPAYYLRRRNLIATEWGVSSTIVRGVVRILNVRKGVRAE